MTYKTFFAAMILAGWLSGCANHRAHLQSERGVESHQDALEEYLWDSCDSLDIMAPIFWQPAWNPVAFANQVVGSLRIDFDTKIEGRGSIHWSVNRQEVERVQSQSPLPDFIMINRLYGQDWGDVRQLRFHIKCEIPDHPPVFVQLVGHGQFPSMTILDRGEMTDGWKEIIWDVSNLDLGVHEEYGRRLWFFRIASRTEWFEENDVLDLHIDNIRLLAAEAEEVVDEPVASLESFPDDYVVWAKHYLEKGSIRSVPRRDEMGLGLHLFATPGESEPTSFCVRALKRDLSRVKVYLDQPLLSTDGAMIPTEQVELRVVKSMKRWLDPSRYMPVETYLVQEEESFIPQSTTQRYWLTVHVPDDALPGVYRSLVVIEPQDSAAQSLELELEVLPFHLVEPDGMAYFMYYSPHLLPEVFQTLDYQRKIFRDMKAHGMTTVTGYFHPVGDILTGSRKGYLPIQPTLEALQGVGLPQDGLPVLWIGADSYGEDYWLEILRARERLNLPEFLFYMIDEPSQKRYAQVEAVMARLDEFRRSYPDYPVRTTTAIGPQGIEDLGHYYDVWVCSAGAVRESMSESARESGKSLWAYECHFAPTQAELSRYYFGFWAWKADVQGCAYWAYYDGAFYNRFGNIGGFEDVEKNWLEWTNQFNFVYPTPDGLIPTLSWEAVREGIDDFRYVQTLVRAIEQAEKRNAPVGLLERARNLLEEIRQLIHVENYRQPTPAELADRPNADIFDRPLPEKNLKPDDYDQLRRRIAEMIFLVKNH